MPSDIGLNRLSLVAKAWGPAGEKVTEEIKTKLKIEFRDGFDDTKARVTGEQLATVRNKYFNQAETPEAQGAQKLLDLVLESMGTARTTAAQASESTPTSLPSTGVPEPQVTKGAAQVLLDQLQAGASGAAASVAPSFGAASAGWKLKTIGLEASPKALLLDWAAKRMYVSEKHPGERNYTKPERLRCYDLASGESVGSRPVAAGISIDVDQVSSDWFSILGADRALHRYTAGGDSESWKLDDFGVDGITTVAPVDVGDSLQHCCPNECGQGLVLCYDDRVEMRDSNGALTSEPIAAQLPKVGFCKAKRLLAVVDSSPSVRFFDAGGEELPTSIETKHQCVFRVGLTPRGDFVVTQGRDSEGRYGLRVNDYATGAETFAVVATTTGQGIADWKINPAGELIILRKDGVVEARNPRTGELIGNPQPPPEKCDDPAKAATLFGCGKLWLSPDGRCIAVAREDWGDTVHVWSAQA